MFLVHFFEWSARPCTMVGTSIDSQLLFPASTSLYQVQRQSSSLPLNYVMACPPVVVFRRYVIALVDTSQLLFPALIFC